MLHAATKEALKTRCVPATHILVPSFSLASGQPAYHRLPDYPQRIFPATEPPHTRCTQGAAGGRKTMSGDQTAQLVIGAVRTPELAN